MEWLAMKCDCHIIPDVCTNRYKLFRFFFLLEIVN